MQCFHRDSGVAERQGSIQSDLNLETKLWEPPSCRAQLGSLQRVGEEGCNASCQAKQWTSNSPQELHPRFRGKGNHWAIPGVLKPCVSQHCMLLTDQSGPKIRNGASKNEQCHKRVDSFDKCHCRHANQNRSGLHVLSGLSVFSGNRTVKLRTIKSKSDLQRYPCQWPACVFLKYLFILLAV